VKKSFELFGFQMSVDLIRAREMEKEPLTLLTKHPGLLKAKAAMDDLKKQDAQKITLWEIHEIASANDLPISMVLQALLKKKPSAEMETRILRALNLGSGFAKQATLGDLVNIDDFRKAYKHYKEICNNEGWKDRLNMLEQQLSPLVVKRKMQEMNITTLEHYYLTMARNYGVTYTFVTTLKDLLEKTLFDIEKTVVDKKTSEKKKPVMTEEVSVRIKNYQADEKKFVEKEKELKSGLIKMRDQIVKRSLGNEIPLLELTPGEKSQLLDSIFGGNETMLKFFSTRFSLNNRDPKLLSYKEKIFRELERLEKTGIAPQTDSDSEKEKKTLAKKFKAIEKELSDLAKKQHVWAAKIEKNTKTQKTLTEKLQTAQGSEKLRIEKDLEKIWNVIHLGQLKLNEIALSVQNLRGRLQVLETDLIRYEEFRVVFHRLSEAMVKVINHGILRLPYDPTIVSIYNGMIRVNHHPRFVMKAYMGSISGLVARETRESMTRAMEKLGRFKQLLDKKYFNEDLIQAGHGPENKSVEDTDTDGLLENYLTQSKDAPSLSDMIRIAKAYEEAGDLAKLSLMLRSIENRKNESGTLSEPEKTTLESIREKWNAKTRQDLIRLSVTLAQFRMTGGNFLKHDSHAKQKANELLRRLSGVFPKLKTMTAETLAAMKPEDLLALQDTVMKKISEGQGIFEISEISSSRVDVKFSNRDIEVQFKNHQEKITHFEIKTILDALQTAVRDNRAIKILVQENTPLAEDIKSYGFNPWMKDPAEEQRPKTESLSIETAA
jgi:hypothetical protein